MRLQKLLDWLYQGEKILQAGFSDACKEQEECTAAYEEMREILMSYFQIMDVWKQKANPPLFLSRDDIEEWTEGIIAVLDRELLEKREQK